MHQTEGGFLKPLIFGGLDGILTSFAIVAGAAGGNMAVPVVLVLGFSNIFADGKWCCSIIRYIIYWAPIQLKLIHVLLLLVF